MKRVELHVFYVPDDQFDRRLNKVSSEAVDTFISAGFIRSVADFVCWETGATCHVLHLWIFLKVNWCVDHK